MGFKIHNNISEGNGGDGFRVNVGHDADVDMGGNIARRNGGQGFNIVSLKDNLVTLGLKPETPDIELAKAQKILSEKSGETIERQKSALKGIGFSRWLSKGAELSTIISLILQSLSK